MAALTTSHSVHTPPKYRPDIDGLRAVAVLLVVFDHLQFRPFEGGYVGVDVFFVISGYLIGSSLIQEFNRDSFSLASFYERRVRRIFPALLTMLAIVSALAYHYLMPEAFVSFAQSLIAAVLSFSNFFFWHQDGYFAAPSAAKPLLHTWSLGVEEQFYVFFPLLLFCVFRWCRRQLRLVLWAVSAITLALAVWTTRFNPSLAFFWSPLRAWELLAGVLISQYSLEWLKSRAARELATLLGLILIIVPGVRYTAQTPFPGWTAIFPCLGATLIIAAGKWGRSLVGGLLSTGPFRFVGLISYSLYLWHWPILVFQNTGMMISDRPSWERFTKIELLLISLVVATLSWWFVETPFRKGYLKLPRTPLFVVSTGVASLLLCLSGWTIYAKGSPSRFPQEVVRVASFGQYDTSAKWRAGTCFLLPENTFRDFKPEDCLSSSPGKKEYLLFGDSTAAQLYPGFSTIYPEAHFQQATASACRPVQDQVYIGAMYRRNCQDLWAYVHHVYLPSHHPDAVILAAAWDTANPQGLEDEIKSFHNAGVPVVLLGPDIEFDLPLPLLLSEDMRRRGSDQSHQDYLSRHEKGQNLTSDGVMAQVAREQWRVGYISYFKDLCGQQVEMSAKSQWVTATGCPLFTDSGEPLIFDEHHLTVSGSILLATVVKRLGQLP